MPNLLVAPKERSTKSRDLYAGGGWYSDGAYTGLPSSGLEYESNKSREDYHKQDYNYGYEYEREEKEGERSYEGVEAAYETGEVNGTGAERKDNIEEEDIDPQEAYYTALLRRFYSFRSALHNRPAKSRSDFHVELVPSPKPATDLASKQPSWSRCLRFTAPTAAHIASLPQQNVIRGLERVESLLTRKTLLAINQGECVGAWAWALLAKCREIGEMGSEDVAIVRELGRAAAKVLGKMRRARTKREAEIKGYDASGEEDQREELEGSEELEEGELDMNGVQAESDDDLRGFENGSNLHQAANQDLDNVQDNRSPTRGLNEFAKTLETQLNRAISNGIHVSQMLDNSTTTPEASVQSTDTHEEGTLRSSKLRNFTTTAENSVDRELAKRRALLYQQDGDRSGPSAPSGEGLLDRHRSKELECEKHFTNGPGMSESRPKDRDEPPGSDAPSHELRENVADISRKNRVSEQEVKQLEDADIDMRELQELEISISLPKADEAAEATATKKQSQLELAKQIALRNLLDRPSSSTPYMNSEDLQEQPTEPDSQSSEIKAKFGYSSSVPTNDIHEDLVELNDLEERAFAALDIIITIVGEVFGQRDLLDAREVWGEFD